jgi:subtilase family serine protease
LGTGEYHVFVRVDAGNVQFESSEANNSIGPISVAITQMLPDLIADNVTFNPATLTSQGQLTVDWTSRNQGAAVTNTGYWIDRIYLSSDNQFSSEDLHIGSLSQNAVLAAGQSRARQATITIPPEISGDYFVVVDSDANGQVIEGAGESNNATASASTVNITLNPTPDLRVSSVDAPLTAFSGQPINIEWTVTNSGIAPATGNWYDAVYLSADQVFDRATDTYLGFRNRPTSLSTTGLAAAGSYTQSGRFEIPLGVAGPLYVFVATDSGGSVFERAAELNNSGYDPVPVVVTLLPPADLVVGTITIPPNSDVGATATISYTVRNQGVNPARGQWQDSLYLSADDSFSIDDLQLGVVNHVGDVAGLGGEYTEVLNAKLPGVIPGNYRIIVRSDIRNAIAESSESNNISGSLNAFEINLPTLTLGVPTVGTLSANESLFWTIELAEGDSVRFKLDNASNDATSFTFTFTAVPEPATWAMMIIGFGAAGSMIRRRRAVVA